MIAHTSIIVGGMHPQVLLWEGDCTHNYYIWVHAHTITHNYYWDCTHNYYIWVVHTQLLIVVWAVSLWHTTINNSSHNNSYCGRGGDSTHRGLHTAQLLLHTQVLLWDSGRAVIVVCAVSIIVVCNSVCVERVTAHTTIIVGGRERLRCVCGACNSSVCSLCAWRESLSSCVCSLCAWRESLSSCVCTHNYYCGRGGGALPCGRVCAHTHTHTHTEVDARWERERESVCVCVWVERVHTQRPVCMSTKRSLCDDRSS